MDDSAPEYKRGMSSAREYVQLFVNGRAEPRRFSSGAYTAAIVELVYKPLAEHEASHCSGDLGSW
jgi:hypothetical protein